MTPGYPSKQYPGQQLMGGTALFEHTLYHRILPASEQNPSCGSVYLDQLFVLNTFRWLQSQVFVLQMCEWRYTSVLVQLLTWLQSR